MVKAEDVAAYILRQQEMTAMKLQKLLYYCQAWSLVWDEEPLFSDAIEAWSMGPVVPAIYRQHKGGFKVGPRWPTGNADLLGEEQRKTIDSVVEHYGRYTAQQLSDLTHEEAPWNRARRGLHPEERSDEVIRHEWMADYYSNLPPAP